MTIIDIAVLQFPTAVTAPSSPGGIGSPVIIRIIPSTHARMHGCVTTFFTVFILSLLPEKTARPEDHIMILCGIRYTLARTSPSIP